jgi:predicted transcriptional regulator of viral defense system
VTERNLPDAIRGSLVKTRAQWRDAGISDTLMQSLIRSGDLVTVRRGVYATKRAIAWGAMDARHSHALQVAAVRSAIPNSVASHHSAALIHGLDLFKPPEEGVVTVTTPPSTRSGRPSGERVIRHAAELPDDAVTTILGRRVTSVARTVIDVARTSTFMEGVVVADSALRQSASGRRGLEAELRRVLEACARWPGNAKARRVAEFADPRAESVLESCARVLFHERGLQPPELQVPMYDNEGDFIGRVDFYWGRHKTIAEADGLMKFDEHPRLEVERMMIRDRRLRGTGRRIVHFTWGELFRDDGYSVCVDIRANFAVRGEG